MRQDTADIIAAPVIDGRLSGSASVAGTVNPRGVIDGVMHTGGTDAGWYTGPYEVEPGSEEQVLETAYKHMRGNVVVCAVPQNYGLITWDGSKLIVS